VTGFTSSDLSVSNGTVSGFSGSGASYSFNLTPLDQGLVTVNIAGGVCTDAAGNGNTAAPQFNRTYDSVRPDVAMSSAASDPTSGSPIPVTVTFTEPVAGFQAGDIAASSATVGGFAGSGAGYQFNLTPTGPGLVTADIAADVAFDAAGNGNTAASRFSRTYNPIPGAPTNLVAMTQSLTEIRLTWRDNAGNEQGFRIERETGTGGAWSQIAAVGPNVNSHRDSGLLPNTTYYYRVCAHNASGHTAWSNEASDQTRLLGIRGSRWELYR